jgi:phosphoribosyl-ATP pyrophosphohydrolase/phosphoribosyl-AMP cyclohydrolase
MIAFKDLRPGPDGLVPAIVQDVGSGSVSMLGYMDAEALERTQATGLVHFHSRSRDALWMKGETSGNTLSVQSIHRDCDDDTLLVLAEPAGPVCHTGSDTCFGPAAQGLGAVVDRLADIIAGRRDADPATSYTARLLADGDLAARKVLEEAGEVAFAYKDLPDGDPGRLTEEAADVLYHLLVLLTAAGIDPADVGAELRARMG